MPMRWRMVPVAVLIGRRRVGVTGATAVVYRPRAGSDQYARRQRSTRDAPRRPRHPSEAQSAHSIPKYLFGPIHKYLSASTPQRQVGYVQRNKRIIKLDDLY